MNCSYINMHWTIPLTVNWDTYIFLEVSIIQLFKTWSKDLPADLIYSWPQELDEVWLEMDETIATPHKKRQLHIIR